MTVAQQEATGTRLVDRCGSCGGSGLESVLHLGTSPPTCAMVPIGERLAIEEHHPLELLVCQDCTLAQLSVVVDPVVMFPPTYPYQSGNSKELHRNFAELARIAGAYWLKGGDDLVVDIGANDGSLLSKFDGYRTVGVEPTEQIRKLETPGSSFVQGFFTKSLATTIREEFGPAKLVMACNVLAHVEDIHDVMEGIDILLADDGVLVAENHDLASVVDGGQWDTVYHEHLRIFSPRSFHSLLQRHRFGAKWWEQISTHGGSFRVWAEKDAIGSELPLRRDYDFGKLARNAAMSRGVIRRSVPFGSCGIGATARATTIINYCGLDVEDIECVCEVPGSDKIGHYIPGTRIPVVEEDGLLEDHPPSVLFSWHLADVIVPKLRERGYKGQIIVPLPTLRYL